MNAPYEDSEPQEPGFMDSMRGFARKFAIVMFLAFGAAAVFHLYRAGQLPFIQQPLSAPEQAPGTARNASPRPGEPPAWALPGSGGASRPGQPGAAGQPVASGGTWPRQSLSMLSVEAPIPLEIRNPTNQGLTPGQLQQIVGRYEWAGKTADGFQVEAVYFEIDGQHTWSLEDAARGPVRHFASLCGDSDPVYGKVDGWLNGLAARHISYVRSFKGINMHLEELVVQRTRSMMGVIVTFPGDARIGDAQRVLASFQVK